MMFHALHRHKCIVNIFIHASVLLNYQGKTRITIRIHVYTLCQDLCVFEKKQIHSKNKIHSVKREFHTFVHQTKQAKMIMAIHIDQQ
jgi:hypothetical protein